MAAKSAPAHEASAAAASLGSSHPFWKSSFLTTLADKHVARRDFAIFLQHYAPLVGIMDRALALAVGACADSVARERLVEAVWGGASGASWSSQHAGTFHALVAGELSKEARSVSRRAERIAEEILRLCGGDHAAPAVLHGLVRPAAHLHERLEPALADLGIAEAERAFLRLPMSAVERALEDASRANSGEQNQVEVTRAVEGILGLQLELHDEVFQQMQSAGIARMLERIQDRKSLASGPVEGFIHKKGVAGTPLYHNRIEKHDIDFTVDSLGFRPEVLEPRIVRIPPGKNNERHRHAHETVFLILAGSGRILVDSQFVEVREGDIIFVPRWAMHQSQNTGSEEMRILAVTDFGLTGKTFIGDYVKTSRMVHAEQAANPNWRVLRAETKATEDYFAPLSVAHGVLPEVWEDPYPIYARARTEAPIYYSERFAAWYVTRYADIVSILREPNMTSKRADEKFRGLEPAARKKFERFESTLEKWLVFLNPPDHTKVRARMNRFFSGVACDALRPRMAAITNELLDAMLAKGSGDVIWDLASPLHFILLAEMLVGEAMDRARLKRWCVDIWSFIAAGAATAERAELAAQASDEMSDYLLEQIARRRKSPGDGILAALMQPDETGAVLSDEQIMATCHFVLSVGHEATWDTIGNATHVLLRHPDALAELRGNLALLPQAVEELLRFDSPVQRVARYATAPLQIGGKQIEKGDFVCLMLAAGNRDPEQFDNPDALDFHRPPIRNLSTGSGIHHCLGGPLGKIEAQVALELMLKRMPKLRLTGEKLLWKPVLALRGLQALPVAF